MTAPIARRIPPGAHLLPDRWFYGWYIALACAALMFVGVGVGYYYSPSSYYKHYWVVVTANP